MATRQHAGKARRSYHSIKETIFGDLDFSSLKDNHEFKEDSVREVIILPLLENANIPIKRINGVGKVEEVTDRLIGVTKELNANATEQESDVNGGEIERSYGE